MEASWYPFRRPYAVMYKSVVDAAITSKALKASSLIDEEWRRQNGFFDRLTPRIIESFDCSV